LNLNIKKWFHDRGIAYSDVAGLLSFFAFVFGRIYTWLNIDRGEEGDRTGGSWFSHTGGLLFAVMMVTFTSGIFLLFYYHPTPESAQASLRYLENEVFLGRTVRQTHAWSASVLIFLIIIHVFRCFIQRSYGRPKELNWIIGSVLLFLGFYFILTGRLMPWDQYSYWKTVANIEVLWDVPILGDFLVNILYGGKDVTWITLIRFYSAHVFVLPLAMVVFLLLHFSLLRRYHSTSPIHEREMDE
jgi:quinol-cytochrome oxidoreductase complex cytochrome b subunit